MKMHIRSTPSKFLKPANMDKEQTIITKREANKRFRCPRCDGKLFVVNSRNRNGFVRLRRYACDSCEHRLSSVEMPVGDLGHSMDGPEANRVLLEYAFRQTSDSELLAEVARRMNR